LGEDGMLNGHVEEAIYIGTDMRYIIRLSDNTKVTVRQQNLDHGRARKYNVGDQVALNWNSTNALVLTE
jgi:spermidine/putrescine transport system ATP-binding protein